MPRRRRLQFVSCICLFSLLFPPFDFVLLVLFRDSKVPDWVCASPSQGYHRETCNPQINITCTRLDLRRLILLRNWSRPGVRDLFPAPGHISKVF